MNIWQLVRLLSLLAAIGSAAPILLYIFSRRFRRLACPLGFEPEPEGETEAQEAESGIRIPRPRLRLKLDSGRLTDAGLVALSLLGGWLVADHFSLHPINAVVIGLGLAALLIYLRRGGVGGFG